ncbi:MAG TPA: ATPase domain-containing protein [Blastocatellia bacterium]|nr:ATPase domain-containing protein [Blastocatellia bacterium]
MHAARAMEVKPPRIVPSGIEPVDKLLGGLESGKLYLVHGEASGKSLFGIKFLIEGLKRGESAALVIRSLPEEAVRRFARLGYDCLEDVYAGRLVILECSDEISQQLSRMRELSPLLRELEWLLGNARPDRLVIDPVTHLLQGEEQYLSTRIDEFASWVNGFGSTVLAITDAEGEKLAAPLAPLVRESFKFEIKETAERATRFLTFEKSPGVPAPAIEVDPRRGVLLLSHTADAPEGEPSSAAKLPAEPARDFTELSNPADLEHIDESEIVIDVPLTEQARAYDDRVNHRTLPPLPLDNRGRLRAQSDDALARTSGLDEAVSAGFESAVNSESPTYSPVDRTPGAFSHGLDTAPIVAPAEQGTPPSSTEEQAPASTLNLDEDQILDLGGMGENQLDDLSYLLDDLAGAAPVLDLDRGGPIPAGATDLKREETIPKPPHPRRRLDDVARDLDSAIASRAVEVILHGPLPDPATVAEREQATPISEEQEAVGVGAPPPRPADFNVLVIADDPASRDLLGASLGEYTVVTTNDGLSALARLISLTPDLIVLDADLPVIDGFKVLKHIRSSLNVPIIMVSGSHVRSSDRILTADLGADYYLAKPFSVKELRQKARQLIARFRGISEWILLPPETPAEQPRAESAASAAARMLDSPPAPKSDRVIPFDGFAAQVEKSVGQAIDSGTSFSVVGCRLPHSETYGEVGAARLTELVNSLTRETDLISSNPGNDLMIFLAEADAAGARAFTYRMRERVKREMNLEPSLWVRSFPKPDDSAGPSPASFARTSEKNRGRRASDRLRPN